MGKINILFSEEETTYPRHKPYFDEWKKKKHLSDKIRRGVDLVIAEEEAKKQKKIDGYNNSQERQTSLDSLPPIWDFLHKDDLRRLDNVDVYKVLKAAYFNLTTCKNYCDELERKEEAMKELSRELAEKKRLGL